MGTDKLLVKVLVLVSIEALVMSNLTNNQTEMVKIETDQDLDTVFNGVYSECILYLSYSCVQNKTLFYLKELNNLSEISIIGEYVKFVKLNNSQANDGIEDEKSPEKDSDELAYLIDKAVDTFFDNHVLKVSGIERQISISNNVEEFVGRKKRKGGGGGHGGHGGDDGGKKKLMMMAMMCMKMKLMMMMPAMMGMMGMMSFKGMMFSMMSFAVSKMMLLMKILEKKGSAGGVGGGLGGVGVGDGGWPAAGGGGAWMPAGGQEYAGTAGGGYDANGQWQSRSLLEKERRAGHDNNEPIPHIDNKPYSDRKTFKYSANEDSLKHKRNKRSEFNAVKYEGMDNEAYSNNGRFKANINKVPLDLKRNKSTADSEINKSIDNEPYFDEIRLKDVANEDAIKPKSNKLSTISSYKKLARNKRSLIDTIQNAYLYWMNRILGLNNNRRANNIPKYRIANGVKYIYYPFRQNVKATKQINLQHGNKLKNENDGFKAINAEDFNRGEIIEGDAESRMNRKKLHKMKEAVNDTIDDNPWE